MDVEKLADMTGLSTDHSNRGQFAATGTGCSCRTVGTGDEVFQPVLQLQDPGDLTMGGGGLDVTTSDACFDWVLSTVYTLIPRHSFHHLTYFCLHACQTAAMLGEGVTKTSWGRDFHTIDANCFGRGIVLFNLLVGLPDGGPLPKDRLLDGTEPRIKNLLNVADGDFGELLKLPTLAMPEIGPEGSHEVAKVGTLSRITPSGTNFMLQFVPNLNIEPVPVNEILANQNSFDVVGGWGFHRTRLMVKDIDLYRTLLELRQSSDVVRPSRKYLNFPDGPTDESLVVVMMPFRPEFEPIWETIQETIFEAGLNCERADSIWDEDSIMDDIVGLLWRARIVITDYTGHNANVFYETGIAHTLGRQCIPITQPKDKIPFDLTTIRTLKYETDVIGLKKLKLDLGRRVRSILKAQ